MAASGPGDVERFNSLWTPEPAKMQLPNVQANSGAPGAAAGTGFDDHKPRTPPPDLPSLLLDSRIVYLGMPVSRFEDIIWELFQTDSNTSVRVICLQIF